MPNNHYRHRHKRVEEIVGEELMKFYSKPKLLGENPKKIIENVKKCPFLLNAFRLSGNSNISILIAGLNFKDIDHIVNRSFRNNPDVSDVHIDIISDVVNDFVLPIDLNFEYGEIEYCCGNCNCNSRIC